MSTFLLTKLNLVSNDSFIKGAKSPVFNGNSQSEGGNVNEDREKRLPMETLIL